MACLQRTCESNHQQQSASIWSRPFLDSGGRSGMLDQVSWLVKDHDNNGEERKKMISTPDDDDDGALQS